MQCHEHAPSPSRERCLMDQFPARILSLRSHLPIPSSPRLFYENLQSTTLQQLVIHLTHAVYIFPLYFSSFRKFHGHFTIAQSLRINEDAKFPTHLDSNQFHRLFLGSFHLMNLLLQDYLLYLLEEKEFDETEERLQRYLKTG